MTLEIKTDAFSSQRFSWDSNAHNVRLPSLFHIFSITTLFKKDLEEQTHAEQTQNTEARISSYTHLIEHPLLTSYTVLSWTNIAIQVTALFIALKGAIVPIFQGLGRAIPLVGIPLSLLEGGLEGFLLYKNRHLKKALCSSLIPQLHPEQESSWFKSVAPHCRALLQRLPENLQQKATWLLHEGDATALQEVFLQADFDYLKTHFFTNQNPDKLKGKMEELSHRVQPWMVKQIAEEVEHPSSLQKRLHIMENIQIQLQKEQTSHLMGLAALTATLAGLILGVCIAFSLIACPATLPLGVLLLGGVLAIGQFFYARGYFKSEGWHFKMHHCLPLWAQRFYTPKEEVLIQAPGALWKSYELTSLKKRVLA